MNETKWSETVLLVDADYVDRVAFDLIVNFERMLQRRIPQADLARWLECVALDGGLRPGGRQSIQAVLLHKEPEMKNFAPSLFAQLDGQAFAGELGEFMISCVQVEDMVTTDDLFADSLHVVSHAEEVRRLVLVPDTDRLYHRVKEGLRHATADQQVTLLTMQPLAGGPFRQEMLGYSLMAALGISASEIPQS